MFMPLGYMNSLFFSLIYAREYGYVLVCILTHNNNQKSHKLADRELKVSI